MGQNALFPGWMAKKLPENPHKNSKKVNFSDFLIIKE